MLDRVNHKKKGYTLVEVIVVGVILALLGVGFTSLIKWSTEESASGHLTSKLHMHAEIIREEVSRMVREGAYTINGDGSENFAGAGGYLTQVNASKIFVYDKSGTYQGGYEINGSNQLMELDTVDGSTSTLLTIVGSDPVTLDASSAFVLHPTRKTLGLNLILTGTSGAISESFTMAADTIRCRN